MRLMDIIEEIYEEPLIEQYNILIESPLRIKTWDADELNTTVKNKIFTQTVKDKATRLNQNFESYEIFSYVVGKSTIDSFIKDDFIVALFMYEIIDNKMMEQKVWQDPIHLGLCRRILFDFYLKKFNGIVSDGVHSELGEKYWIKLMDKAQKLGFKSYVLIKGKEEIFDFNQINKYYASMNTRFVIEK